MKWQKKRFFQSIKSNQRGRLFDGQSGGTTAQSYIYYKTSSGDNVMKKQTGGAPARIIGR